MRRIPALDGLRGVAVLLVVVFHAWPDLLPAGGYGVTVFFVLSGFLITGILLRDADSGGIDFKRFYWNRAIRLLPALALTVIAYLILFDDWTPALWAVGYVANVGAIVGEGMSGLSHTWSLAVEEHFYVVWPLIVGFVPKACRLRSTAWFLGVAVAWRIGMMTFDGSFDRVRYATDTVAFALLAGCLLAVFHHEGRLRIPSPTVTLAAVAGVCVVATVFPNRTMLFLWGELVVVGLSMVAVAGCLQSIRLLERRGLVWIGLVSYGLYLWHFLIFSQLDRTQLVEALILSVAMTWVSSRWVEQPIRRRFRSHHPRVFDEYNPAVGSDASRPAGSDMSGGEAHGDVRADRLVSDAV